MKKRDREIERERNSERKKIHRHLKRERIR